MHACWKTLPIELAIEVHRKWPQPTGSALEWIFKKDLYYFIILLGSDTLNIKQMTRCIKLIGTCHDSGLVRFVLGMFLNHEHARIREQACESLKSHVNDNMMYKLTNMMESDPDEHVRLAAARTCKK